MNGTWAPRVRRWTLPIWIAYSAIWVVWWGYRLGPGGGLEYPGEAVTMVLSGITAVIGLLLGWSLRRDTARVAEDPRQYRPSAMAAAIPSSRPRMIPSHVSAIAEIAIRARRWDGSIHRLPLSSLAIRHIAAAATPA